MIQRIKQTAGFQRKISSKRFSFERCMGIFVLLLALLVTATVTDFFSGRTIPVFAASVQETSEESQKQDALLLMEKVAETRGEGRLSLPILLEQERVAAVNARFDAALESMEERVNQVKEERAKAVAAAQEAKITVTQRERDLLYRLVQAEAGGQPYEGICLVANVVLNRVNSKTFPGTIEKVIFSPGQFTPAMNGGIYRVKVSETVIKAVDEVLDGRDDSQGALYFVAKKYLKSKNTWFDRAKTWIMKVGDHDFYK